MIYKRLSGSFAICLTGYVAAFIAAYSFVLIFDESIHILWLTFFADIIATIVIFFFSLTFKNSSFYDPYWSVAPFVIVLYWNRISEEEHSLRNNLIIAAFFLWGLRLTLNWVRGWKGLQHEDWRYVALKKQTGTFYPLVNFAGIHLFPTLMVFTGMLPAYYAIMNSSSTEMNTLDGIAFAVCITATVIELIADEQLRTFKRHPMNQGKFCSSGLWRYSRHPNYFGELLFWWGIFLFAIAANLFYWWTIIGAAAMTLMFVFISIPMMEKHMVGKRPAYGEYQKQVSRLIPWFRP